MRGKDHTAVPQDARNVGSRSLPVSLARGKHNRGLWRFQCGGDQHCRCRCVGRHIQLSSGCPFCPERPVGPIRGMSACKRKLSSERASCDISYPGRSRSRSWVSECRCSCGGGSENFGPLRFTPAITAQNHSPRSRVDYESRLPATPNSLPTGAAVAVATSARHREGGSGGEK